MELPKLGSFDPSVLKGLDSLKSITLDDVKDFAIRRKMELLAAGIFIIALVGVGFISNSTNSSLQALTAKKNSLQEKTAPIKKFQEAIKQQETFLSALPPALGEHNFITVLTEIANKNDVRITDFTPPVAQEDRFLRRLTSKFTCSAQAFSNAIMFISDLEQSEYAIKLDNWSMHLQQAKTKGGALGNLDKNPSGKFIMDMVVSSTKIEPESKNKTDAKPKSNKK